MDKKGPYGFFAAYLHLFMGDFGCILKIFTIS